MTNAVTDSKEFNGKGETAGGWIGWVFFPLLCLPSFILKTQTQEAAIKLLQIDLVHVQTNGTVALVDADCITVMVLRLQRDRQRPEE